MHGRGRRIEVNYEDSVSSGYEFELRMVYLRDQLRCILASQHVEDDRVGNRL